MIIVLGLYERRFAKRKQEKVQDWLLFKGFRCPAASGPFGNR